MVERTPRMSTGIANQVVSWLKNIQFCLLPGICVLCRKASGQRRDLCVRCIASLPRVHEPCPSCGLPLPPGIGEGQRCGRCLGAGWPIAQTVTPFAWDDPVSVLIHRFKYRDHLAAGYVLADLLAETVSARYRETPLPELLLPVPLHPARLRERGYNQALLLARQLGSTLGIPVLPRACSRIRQTPPQQGLSAWERRRNLRDAFMLSPEPDWRQLRRVALIDDVVTTMSTVTTLARLLHQASGGRIDVHVWALARA